MECTKNHQFMTLDSSGNFVWTKLEDINIGDPLIVKSGMQSFGNNPTLIYEERPIEINQHLGYIAGSLVSESSHSGNTVYYHNYDVKLNQVFTRAIKEVFLVEPRTIYELRLNGKRISKRAAKNVMIEEVIKQETAVRIPSKLGKWLLDVFEIECGACDKRIPNCILESSRETQIQFLEGLFLGDGSIRYKKNKVARFTYGTCSETLAIDLQCVLLNFGIYSRLHTERNSKHITFFRNLRNLMFCLL